MRTELMVLAANFAVVGLQLLVVMVWRREPSSRRGEGVYVYRRRGRRVLVACRRTNCASFANSPHLAGNATRWASVAAGVG
ncbi:MAG: hypothetical protein KF757_03580 [Phycisphaeraceae bacterium]|nr:hypothetical protein [Phycisphaeraceae bacterium]MCW5763084.1 hypothetical protein [Phycisphaeraceae bacterium]